MRGEVFRYDDNTGEGLISGDDGNRYNFTRADLKQLASHIGRGTRVDFDNSEAGQARDIYLVDAAPQPAPAAAAPPLQSSNENLGLWGYFAKCMGKYVDGNGRARRKEFWSFVLFSTLFTLPGYAIDITWNASVGNIDQGIFLPVVAGLISLVFLLPGITVSIRRLHDIGMSGWLILIPIVIALIPYAGFLSSIFMLVVGLIPSQLQTNAHGPYPKPLPPQGAPA